jgi:hypothetical protein
MLLPPDASFSDIASLKNKTLGPNVDSHTLVRALLPYADLDYAQCSLPKPSEQKAVIPSMFPNDTYAGKTYCSHCSEWYLVGQTFLSHLDACVAFFLGRNTIPPYIRCEYCGDVYRKNAGCTQHKIICQRHARKAKCTWCPELFEINDTEHQAKCYLNPNRGYVVKCGGSSPSPCSTPPSNAPTGPTSYHSSRQIQQPHTPIPSHFTPSGGAPTFVMSSDTSLMSRMRASHKAGAKKTIQRSSPIMHHTTMRHTSDLPQRQHGHEWVPSSSSLAPQGSRGYEQTSLGSNLLRHPPVSPNPHTSPYPSTSPYPPGSPFSPSPGPGQG